MRPPQAEIPPKMSAGLATRYLSALSPQTGHFHPRALMPCSCIAACISPSPSSVLAPSSSILSSCQNFSSPLMHPPPGFSSPFILALAPVLTQVNLLHCSCHKNASNLQFFTSRSSKGVGEQISDRTTICAGDPASAPEEDPRPA